MKVSILGLGYIGLPTAVMLASNGVRVKGVDINEIVCSNINNCENNFTEPGLHDLIVSTVNNGMLSASTSIEKCDCFIVSVPTPMTEEKHADLSFVINAAESISSVLQRGNLVILESTVPPRCTIDCFVHYLEKGSQLKAGKDFMVAHCPERVLPGRILHELVYNGRIIGGLDEASARAAVEIYGNFVNGDMIITDTVTAEMCKLMENTFRDVNIALANELAEMCEHLGIDAWKVIQYANKHPRVHLHQPGPGVGGHCLAVDPWFVIEAAPDKTSLIHQARIINDGRPSRILERIRSILPHGGKIVLLGCTYKPDVDDIRESPILHLECLAKDAGLNTVIVDPYVEQYNVDMYKALEDADLAILAVHHKDFSKFDYKRAKSAMRSPNLLDTRCFLDRNAAEKAGMNYFLIGSSQQRE